MFIRLQIQQKVVLFGITLLLFSLIVTRLMLYTLDQIDNQFNQYKQNATNCKIATLEISSDLNFISRCTRDIMLGSDYNFNMAQIEEKAKSIDASFNKLYILMKDQDSVKLKTLIDANKTTKDFIYNATQKVSLLKSASKDDMQKVYQEYHSSSTPLANLSRGYVESLKKEQDKVFEELNGAFSENIKKQKLIIGISSFIFTVIIAIIMYIGFRQILKRLKIEEDLNQANSLLLQYKYAIDLTNIVSKTDKNGVITYVNDAFCKISQYSKNELIGNNHNLIRHENTKPEIFKEMWETISQNMVWNGIIENKNKNGDSYYADTTIVPIMNNNNEVDEYIAIRKDITDIVRLNQKLEESQSEILNRIGMLAESRSKETSLHVKRVAEYSRILANGLGFDDVTVNLVASASALHDVGKIAIPDNILLKPSKLTFIEFEEMKKHSEYGYAALKDSNSDIINIGSIIAYEHHEKWDGSGYPRGLSGESIHIYARIVALADVFDALGSKRTYKASWDLPQIINYINDQSGKHFDPKLVQIFNEKLDSFIFIRKKFRSSETDF